MANSIKRTLLCIFCMTIFGGLLSCSVCKASCWPLYRFCVPGTIKTTYEPKLNNSDKKKIGVDSVKRIFYGWEKVRLSLSVSLPPIDVVSGDCSISVDDPTNWFKTCKLQVIAIENKQIVFEDEWKSQQGSLGKKSTEIASVIRHNKVQIEEVAIAPINNKGKSLDSGYYRIQVICDMDEMAYHWQGVEVGNREVISGKRVVGWDVIHIIKPGTNTEYAEEEIHKAYWKGLNNNDAIYHLERALQYDPNGVNTMILLSTAYRSIGEIEESKRLINICRQIDPRCLEKMR